MAHTTIASPLRPLTAMQSTVGPIVVAVGGQDPTAALRAVRVFARQSPAGVVALAVLEPLPIYAFGEEPRLPPPSFDSERQAALQARLEALVGEVSEEPGAWRTEVQIGDPARVIAQVAARERSPLIIMGIGRHGIMDRLLQRETTVRTVRLARSPVLAVAGDLTSPPRRVLAATDFSAESARAAQVAAELMDEQGTLTFLHAWQPAVVTDAHFAEALAASDNDYERGLPDRFARLQAVVAAPEHTAVRHIHCRGDAAHALIHHAEELDADLVAVGRHGKGVIERMVVGSVTSAMLRSATWAVLVAPTPPAVDRERLQLQVAGSSESWAPNAWSDMLARFTQRNRGRLTTLVVDDPTLGAYTQESGYPFQGAAYDQRDERIELMFGSGRAGRTHLSRSITAAHYVTLEADEHGVDTGLTISHGQAETVLRFTSGVLHR